MSTWSDSDGTVALGDALTLPFTIHDVPFLVRANDDAVIAHVARLVQRYRTAEGEVATGPRQELIALQGVPTIDDMRLTDVPRRSGTRKPARVATADLDDTRVILRRETGVVTTNRTPPAAPSP
ncbi:MAG: hypothetical protein LC793_05085 [Thermomicrobia bacterium]|nr:hypothetical protein [Thermomicrobia bacterium]